MGEHIDAAGRFQSDKYSWCPPDFVPLKMTDPAAQRALYAYAAVQDPQDCSAEHWSFVQDILTRLEALGYKPPGREPKPLDPNTPIGAGVARDHAIARFFNIAEHLARKIEPLIDDAIAEELEARKGNR